MTHLYDHRQANNKCEIQELHEQHRNIFMQPKYYVYIIILRYKLYDEKTIICEKALNCIYLKNVWNIISHSTVNVLDSKYYTYFLVYDLTMWILVREFAKISNNADNTGNIYFT